MVRRINFKAAKYFLLLLIVITLIFWVIGCDILGFKDIDMREVIDGLTTKDPEWGFDQKLMASDGMDDDTFGNSVCVSGDGVIIGAEGDDTFQGSAYIYRRGANGWVFEDKIDAGVGDRDAEDSFGHSVSISGDYAIVGAYLDDEFGASAGAAYIFKRSGGTWSLLKKLTSQNGTKDGDRFGISVAISGEYAVVGSSRDDELGTDTGAAFIYYKGADTWNHVLTLYAGDPHSFDELGYSVDIDGGRIIVGAHKHDDDHGVDPNTDEGAAYIYIGSGTSWPEEDMITFADLADLSRLGTSVAIYNEFALAGAPYMDNLVGLFKDRPGNWEGTKLVPGDVIFSDNLGYSIDIADTYLVLGARQKDSNKGAVYIYIFDGKVWSQHRSFIPNDGNNDDKFGQAVSISDKYIAVGAYYHDVDYGVDTTSNEGAVYIYKFE
jgi:hypothetical protein